MCVYLLFTRLLFTAVSHSLCVYPFSLCVKRACDKPIYGLCCVCANVSIYYLVRGEWWKGSPFTVRVCMWQLIGFLFGYTHNLFVVVDFPTKSLAYNPLYAFSVYIVSSFIQLLIGCLCTYYVFGKGFILMFDILHICSKRFSLFDWLKVTLELYSIWMKGFNR